MRDWVTKASIDLLFLITGTVIVVLMEFDASKLTIVPTIQEAA